MGEHVDDRALATAVKEVRVALISALVLALRADGFERLRVPHLQVLENIEPAGTRLTALAERCRMSHQAMGELVAELAELGYVERAVDPADGRARLVRPTARGLELTERMWAHLAAIRAQWQRRLPDVHVDQVVEALSALVRVCQSEGVAREG